MDLEIGLHEVTPELERLCRYLEPCGTGNAEPGVRRAGRAASPAGTGGQGHLKGALDDGAHRLPAIGFQWADRVPWLGDDLVDAAFRIELQRVERAAAPPGAALRAGAAACSAAVTLSEATGT